MKSGACKGCTMRTVGCHGKNPDGTWKCRDWGTPSEPSKTGPTGKGRATERMRNRRRRFRMVRSLRGRSRKPRRRSGRRPHTPEWRPASVASTSRRASIASRASARMDIKAGRPARTQRSGPGGERTSNEAGEESPQAVTREAKFVRTKGGDRDGGETKAGHPVGGWLRGPHGCLGDRGELGAGHGGGGQILGRALGKGGGQLRAEAADRGGAQEYLLPVQADILRAAAHVHRLPGDRENGGAADAACPAAGLSDGKSHIKSPWRGARRYI